MFWRRFKMLLVVNVLIFSTINLVTSKNQTNSSLLVQTLKHGNTTITDCQLTLGGVNTSIGSNQTKFVSACMHCTCINQTVTCYQRQYNHKRHMFFQKKLCADCRSIRKIKCFHCVDHDGILRHHEEKWNPKLCMLCNCLYGHTICKFSTESKTSANEAMEMVKTTCKECKKEVNSTLNLYKCIVCQDGSKTRTWLKSWVVPLKSNVYLNCFCNKKGIECSAQQVIEDIPIITRCRNCTTDHALQLYGNTGCKFQGVNFDHGDFKYISMFGTVICLQCACFLNQIACSFKHSWLPMLCIGHEMCNMMMKAKIIENSCSRSIDLKCPSSPISWAKNGCYYSCYKGQLNYSVVQMPWCKKLSTVGGCPECPELKTFLTTYNSTVFQCKSGEYIWKDRVCDTFMDCDDQSDEMNCSTHYCRMGVSSKLNYRRKKTAVNDIFSIGCEIVSEMNWTGLINTECFLDKKGIASFGRDDFCGCIDLRLRSQISKAYNDRKVNANALKNVSNLLISLSHMNIDSLHLFEMTIKLFEEVTNNTSREVLAKLAVLGHRILNHHHLCENARTKSYVGFIGTKVEELKKTAKISGNEWYSLTAWVKMFIYKSLIKTSMFENPVQLMFHSASQRLTSAALGNLSDEELSSLLSKENMKRSETFEQYHGKIIVDVEHVTACFSISCLLVALICFKILRIKNTRKIIIHKNLMAMFLLTIVIQRIPNWIISDMHKFYRKSCIGVALLSYYVSLASFTWMMLEGINITLILVLVFKRKNKRLKEIFICGYGLPLIITLTVMAIRWESFEDTSNCITLKGSLWIVKGPMALFIFINSILMTVILTILCKVTKRNSKAQSSKRTGLSLKAFLSLVPLLGLSFLIGLFIEYEPVYLGYIYVICNGLTSFFLLMFHCLLDPQVQKNIRNMKDRLSKIKASSVSRNYDISNNQSTTEFNS